MRAIGATVSGDSSPIIYAEVGGKKEMATTGGDLSRCRLLDSSVYPVTTHNRLLGSLFISLLSYGRT